MKHARADYDRFQDPAGLIPDDEPVFLVRGQDLAAPATMRAWADLALAHGASTDIVQRVREFAGYTEAWQVANRAKVPDLAPGA